MFSKWRVIAAVLAGLAVLAGVAFALSVLLVVFGGEKASRCSFYSGFARGEGYGLSWSPTGAEIAFGYADSFPPDIYVVKVQPWPKDLKLSKPLSLTAHGRWRRLDNSNCASAFPSWSPDRRRIAYAGNYGAHARYDVWVMNNDGSGAHMVTRGHGSDTGGDKDNTANAAGPKPEWSPDGRQLAFDTKDAAGTPTVWLVRSVGRGLSRLTPPSLPARRPSWSPDGRRIALGVAGAGVSAGIWLIDRDGSHLRQLTHGSDSDPAWSPDGRSIAFDRLDGDRTTIWLTPSGEGPESQLTTDDDYLPEWSPDGNWIAFISSRDGGAHLYVMDARGLIERPLFSNQ